LSLLILVALATALAVYWYKFQIQPDRQREALLRHGLGEGLLTALNESRHEKGLPLLEVDDDLMDVAEGKAVHQVRTGASEDGWEYPAEYRTMFGRSLLMETLLVGRADTMKEKLLRQAAVMDGEWIRCGIGAAGGQSGRVIVAMVLCREAWEPVPEVAQNRPFAERLV
jgi:hypothetical protein